MIFKFVFYFFFVVTVNLCFAQNPRAFQKQNTVVSIDVQTENRFLLPLLKKILRGYKNKTASPSLKEDISKALQAFWIQNKVLLPKVKGPFFKRTKSGVVLFLRVKEDYRYGFVLRGNQSLTRSDLLPGDIWFKLFNDKNFFRKLRLYFTEAYLKRGYSSMEMDYQVRTDKKWYLKTVYMVLKEGYVQKIKNLNMRGRFSRPARFYIKLLKKYSSRTLRRRVFYNLDMEEALQSVVNSLKNEGYLKAEAYFTVKRLSPARLVVDVFLNEGPLVKVESVTFKGNRFFKAEELKKRMHIKKNSGLNIHDLEKDIAALVLFYQSRGFMNMELKSKDQIVRYEEEKGLVHLNFVIEEGQPVVLSDIVITGNKITRSDFIHKNLKLKKGDVVTPDRIEKSMKNLREKGHFASLNVFTQQRASGSEGDRLVVQVEERKPRTMRTALGFNTERALTGRGLFEFSYRNIQGKGHELFSHLKLQSNMARFLGKHFKAPEHLEHQVSFMYRDPFLWGSNLSGEVHLSESSQVFSHTYRESRSLTDVVNTLQMDLILYTTITEGVRLQWNLLNWENRREFKKGEFCLTFPSRPLCRDKTLNITTHGLSLNIDKRNHILFASDGFLSHALLEYSGPFYPSDYSKGVQFIKMEVKHFDFQPLPRSWVWVNNLQGGIIANISKEKKDSGVPVSRAFILGGVNSLRGFDGLIQGERVPDKEELPIEGGNALIPTRSWLYLLLKTELRFRIRENWMGSLFYNGGFVNVAGYRFQRPYRQAAGFGLRYQTLFGPISLYVGFKIRAKEQESLFVSHLSLGTY